MKALFLQPGYNKGLLFLFLMLFFMPFFSFSQAKKTGTIEYLKYCNGVNGITLGANISSVNYSKWNYLDGDNKLDADSCLKFACTDSAVLKISNNLNLDMIGIRTYKDKIVNIYLFFRKADAYKILSNFLNAYGVFTYKPYEYKNIYNWDSRSISLSLMYQADVDDGVAVFTCNPLMQDIAEAKEVAEMKKKAMEIKALKESVYSISLMFASNP